MSLWTPGGEHPIDRGRNQGQGEGQGSPSGPPPGAEPGAEADDLSPEEHQRLEDMRQELDDVRRQLREAPAAVVVANHAMGLYELAAIHLTAEQPTLSEAVLAIDALAALVDGLTGRLGEAEPTLTDALAQLRTAYLEVRQRAGPEGDAPVDS